jgi:hypothetical protein
MFLWNSVLYAVLVLFPWLLLLLFLYRKRVNLAAQIHDDLLRLDPKEDLLKRVLQGNSARREQERIQQIFPAKHDKKRGGELRNDMRQYPHMATPEKREQAIVDALAQRTFGEFEYLLSMIFLTLLLAVGWYYVFYPQTSIGLSFLIERGAGARQLLAFITTNLTPLTMGFAGAYFFLMQMLVRRYLSNDLYPTAFLQAALRLLIVFLLSLALTLLSTIGVDPNSYVFTKDLAIPGAIALILAFLVGIYPTSGLKLIVNTVNQWFHKPIFPLTLIPEPLTKLTGVTLWVEARLFEEKIDTIEAMATVQIEQLIINTHFPTAQIVDWVDQAILYLHSGHNGEWYPQLRTVGIRGATDFLDAAGFNLLEPYESLERDAGEPANKRQRHEFYPDPKALQCLANAITEANASGVPQPGGDDPRGIAASTMENLRREADHSAQRAQRAAELIGQINSTQPDTYNYARMVDAGIEKTRAEFDTVVAASGAIEQTVNKLTLSPDISSPASLVVQLNADIVKVRTSAQQVPAINKGGAARDVALNDPETAKLKIAELGIAIEIAEKSLTTLERSAEEIGQASAPPPELPGLVAELADLRQTWEALKKDLAQATRYAKRIDPSDPTTYDARAELMHIAEQLGISAQALDSDLAQMRAITSQTELTMTQPQRKMIDPALTNAEQGLQKLHTPLEQTFNYARTLWPHPPSAPAQVSADKKVAAEIGEAFTSVHEKIQYLNTALATIIQPPQLTVDILCVICDSIWPDPNIAYVLNYNQRTILDLVGAPLGNQEI